MDPKCNHRHPYKREARRSKEEEGDGSKGTFEGGTLLALKEEKGAMSEGMQGVIIYGMQYIIELNIKIARWHKDRNPLKDTHFLVSSWDMDGCRGSSLLVRCLEQCFLKWVP